MSSVVIYTYYNSSSSNFNLSYFVNNELLYRENVDYIIVINGFECDHSIVFPQIPNLTVIRRENKGFDFGGHNSALEHIDSINKKYDYYFFMNSGVIGPIMPHYFKLVLDHWSSIFIKKINNVVKLVGTTIVCLPPEDLGGVGPKVEGFFFMVDQIGLDLLRNQKTIFCDHATKIDAILNGEYALSTCMFNNGYSIDCMLRKYQNIDWRNTYYHKSNNNNHPSRKNSFYGNTIIPYEVIFHKWFWINQANVNFEIITQYVNNNT